MNSVEAEYVASVERQLKSERRSSSVVRIEVNATNGLALYKGMALITAIEQSIAELLELHHITTKRYVPPMKGAGMPDFFDLIQNFINGHSALLSVLAKIPALLKSIKTVVDKSRTLYYSIKYRPPKIDLTPRIDIALHCLINDHSGDRPTSILEVKRSLFELISLTPVIKAQLKEKYPELEYNFSFTSRSARSHFGMAVYSHIDNDAAIKKLRHAVTNVQDNGGDIFIRLTRKGIFKHIKIKFIKNAVFF